MDNSAHDMSEKLIQYLDNELTGAEKASLEQQLAHDKVLSDQLEQLLLAREAIKLHGLQQKVASVHQTMMAEMATPVKKMEGDGTRYKKKLRRFSIAVAATLLVLVAGYMFLNKMTVTPEKVFTAHYDKYELTVLRDGNPTETPVEKAYREANYREVLRIHDAGEDHTPKGEFLCGAASLEVKDTEKAIKCFTEVLDMIPGGILREQAEYYLSLSYIRNTNYDNALVILNKIREEPGHLYNQRVTPKMLRQVKKLQRN